jgi:hypothetical protein
MNRTGRQSTEENLEPKLPWLQEGLGMDEKVVSSANWHKSCLMHSILASSKILNQNSHGSKRG